MLANAPVTYESECLRILIEARDVARRFGKDAIKFPRKIDGWRMSLLGRPLRPGIERSTVPLPKELGKNVAPMLRRTYLILLVLRHEKGPHFKIQAGEISERWLTACPHVEPNLGTIKQMLIKLRDKKVIYHTDDRGWVFGQPQGTLFSEHDCRERCTLPRARFVWVPGEMLSQYVVVVADSITNRAVEVAGWDGTYLRFQSWNGRVKEWPAVRAEVIEREDRLLLVKLSNGERVYAPVFGDWHLEGRSSNVEEESETD